MMNSQHLNSEKSTGERLMRNCKTNVSKMATKQSAHFSFMPSKCLNAKSPNTKLSDGPANNPKP